MSQPLPLDETKFDKNNKLQDILNTTADSDIEFFVEVGLTYPGEIKENSRHFPLAPEKIYNPDNFDTNNNKNKSNLYTQTKKLICVWSDKKNYMIHCRMLEFYVRHGKVVDKSS